MTLELLERIASLFLDYFGSLSEDVLKDNFVTCYELLEELADNGFPVTTEPTLLKDLVPPPSLLNRLRSAASAPATSSSSSPPVHLEHSAVPWRKAGVRYANNEIFFDVVEELDAIIDVNGQLVSSEITGKIEVNSRLSGMPEVLTSFVNPQVMEDVAFHPCVRYARYEQDRSLSFIPPDGCFELMRYRSHYSSPAPFYVTPKVSLHKDSGRVNIMMGLKGLGGGPTDKGVHDVRCTVQLPENTESAKLEATVGSYFFDTLTKELRWDVGRLTSQKSPSLTGSIYATSGTTFPEQACPTVLVDFRIPMTALSGIKIDTVLITNERYKPYKGVRALTKAGQYQIRLV